jgi:hypothetical protein
VLKKFKESSTFGSRKLRPSHDIVRVGANKFQGRKKER